MAEKIYIKTPGGVQVQDIEPSESGYLHTLESEKAEKIKKYYKKKYS